MFFFSDLSKRSGLSLEFIDSILNDPLFAESEEPFHDESFLEEPGVNEANDVEPMLAEASVTEKDPLFNVIPGVFL